MNRKSLQLNGFSLLELIVVLAGLGILSSLAIPNFMRLLDFNNIDEAKALLNAAAADCLQKSRVNDSALKDLIDDEILSDQRLKTIGYRIELEADKCSYLQIIPTNEEDSIRFPIGFSVADGKLTKFASPTSTDQASNSACESWAGINCKQDENLKTWIGMLKEIEEQKQLCNSEYQTWLSQTNPVADGPKNKWNTNAESACSTRPPDPLAFTTTCTPNGCNSTVFAFEGKIVGTTQEDYNQALDEKYGELCKEWVNQEININNYYDTPKTSQYCGPTQFWFCKGKQWGTKEEMNGCLLEVESERCVLEKEERFQSGIPGEFKPEGTTLECQTVWYCFEEEGAAGNPYTSESAYLEACDSSPGGGGPGGGGPGGGGPGGGGPGGGGPGGGNRCKNFPAAACIFSPNDPCCK